jgi:hypothetical protein
LSAAKIPEFRLRENDADTVSRYGSKRAVSLCTSPWNRE